MEVAERVISVPLRCWKADRFSEDWGWRRRRRQSPTLEQWRRRRCNWGHAEVVRGALRPLSGGCDRGSGNNGGGAVETGACDSASHYGGGFVGDKREQRLIGGPSAGPRNPRAVGRVSTSLGGMVDCASEVEGGGTGLTPLRPKGSKGFVALEEVRSGRMDEADVAKVEKSLLYFDIPPSKKPLIYSPKYDIGFLGLEKLHPFDSRKWGRIKAALVADSYLKDDEIVEPREATEDDLLVAHTERYLKSLKSSFTVAQITELVPIMFLPHMAVNASLLRPLRLHTGGTVLAGKLALERGWAINLGGGFHHCYDDEGGGFCAYADISLCIKFARMRMGISRVMIIDLDAHQGNGHERDFNGDKDVFILDVYNSLIYPQDYDARKAIALAVELRIGADDSVYLPSVEEALAKALTSFKPELIIYNAGTDVLMGDPLGRLAVTPDGVVKRDEMVFQFAREIGSPIVMVTSGGYQRTNAGVIARSIENLARGKLIDLSGPGVVTISTSPSS